MVRQFPTGASFSTGISAKIRHGRRQSFDAEVNLERDGRSGAIDHLDDMIA